VRWPNLISLSFVLKNQEGKSGERIEKEFDAVETTT